MLTFLLATSLATATTVQSAPSKPARPMRSASADSFDAAAIKRILSVKIDKGLRAPSAAVALIDGDKTNLIMHGRCCGPNSSAPTEQTVFELGSLTKVFTAALLADMIVKGEVSGYDPVNKYLPEAGRMTSSRGQRITLRQLVDQTSGLPRWPADFTGDEAAYTVDQLFAFVRSYEPPREPGAERQYSNLGYGLHRSLPSGWQELRDDGSRADHRSLGHEAHLHRLGSGKRAIGTGA